MMTPKIRSPLRVVLVLLAATSAAAPAQAIDEMPTTPRETAGPEDYTKGALDDSQLADIRGGFTNANGTTFSFAVSMTTRVNGQVALATTLQLNAQGMTTSETVGPRAENLNQAQKFGLNLAGLPQSGVIVPGPGGASAIIQNTSGQIMNVLVNNASGQSIVQNTSVTLIVPNLPTLKEEAQLNSVGAAVASAINSALVQMGGR